MEPDIQNNQPLEANQNSSPNTVQNPTRNFFSKKILLLIAGILLATILIGAFLFIRNKSSEEPLSNLPVEPENLLLATVAKKEIRRNDVRDVALEQILSSGIDSDALKTYLNVAIERAILDHEASQTGIIIPPTPNKIDYYEALKQEVIKGELTEITAYDVSWWLPSPAEYEQTPEFETQRREGQLAAQEIANALRAGSTPIQIVPGIIDKYPSLEGIIGINGGLYSSTEDKSSFQAPRIYQYDSENLYLPFYEVLYSMQSGEITTNIWENGSGAAIIYVTDLKRGASINYGDWLNGKKAELVTLYQDNIDQL